MTAILNTAVPISPYEIQSRLQPRNAQYALLESKVQFLARQNQLDPDTFRNNISFEDLQGLVLTHATNAQDVQTVILLAVNPFVRSLLQDKDLSFGKLFAAAKKWSERQGFDSATTVFSRDLVKKIGTYALLPQGGEDLYGRVFGAGEKAQPIVYNPIKINFVDRSEFAQKVYTQTNVADAEVIKRREEYNRRSGEEMRQDQRKRLANLEVEKALDDSPTVEDEIMRRRFKEQFLVRA